MEVSSTVWVITLGAIALIFLADFRERPRRLQHQLHRLKTVFRCDLRCFPPTG